MEVHLIQEEEVGRSRKKKRGGRRLGRKRSPSDERPRGEGEGKQKKKGKQTLSSANQGEEMDEYQVVSMAGSFCQAVAELQFVGVCRGSKRRKGVCVTRSYFAPEAI